MRKYLSVLVIAIITGVSASPTFGRSTGWVNGYQWIRIYKSLEKAGEMPVSVVCKDSGARGLTFNSGLAKVEIQKNPGNIAWYWAFGDRVNQVKRRLEKQGFVMVSYSEYRRASGLKIPCAIWHKKQR